MVNATKYTVGVVSLVGVCLLSLLSLSVQSQEPTPVLPEIRDAAFPQLDCDELREPFDGPTWNGITIGISDLATLRAYVENLNAEYIENTVSYLQIVDFYKRPNSDEPTSNEPDLISACVHPDNNLIIGMYIAHGASGQSIFDFVGHYVEPDIVAWDVVLDSRVLIWLTEGVAISVSVDPSEQFRPYGDVTIQVYFPYQTLEDYEGRYPYTHLAVGATEIITRTPDAPHEQNPFDFDSIIATVTAQALTVTPVPIQATPTSQP